MNNDIENNINKIYQYFSVYTVRIEQLKEYYEFTNCEYKRLLSHSKTRWLSLFPGISRLLKMFSPFKPYFLSQEHPPIVIKRFFESGMSELYIWHMRSLMSVFHKRIQVVERENNFVAEAKENLELVHKVLVKRKNENFTSLTVKRLLVEEREEGYEDECNNFLLEVANLNERCLEYLCKWMKLMEEFACFKWMTLKEIPSWKDVEPCLEYLIGKGVDVYDAKYFDQICNLKQFIESYLQHEEFIKLPTHKKWCKYCDQSKNITCHSEILRIVRFFFAVTSHNANVERVFSLMQS